MVAPSKPTKAVANGKDTWWWVPGIADMTEPVTTEVNSASGLNITCYLLAEQDGVTSNTDKVRLARLLCETTTTESLGEQTFSLSDLIAVFDPQAASGHVDKKAWTLLKAGGDGFLIRRQNVVSKLDVAVSADQFVDVFKVTTGEGVPGKSATDPSGIYTFTAPVALIAKEFNVQVVAP